MIDLWVVLLASLGAALWAVREYLGRSSQLLRKDPGTARPAFLSRRIGWILSPFLHALLAALAAWSVGKIGAGGRSSGPSPEVFPVATPSGSEALLPGTRVPDLPVYDRLRSDDPEAEPTREEVPPLSPPRDKGERGTSLASLPSEWKPSELLRERFRELSDGASGFSRAPLLDHEGGSQRDRLSVSETSPRESSAPPDWRSARGGGIAPVRATAGARAVQRPAQPTAPSRALPGSLRPGIPSAGGVQAAALGRMLRDLQARLLGGSPRSGILTDLRGLLQPVRGGIGVRNPSPLAARGTSGHPFFGETVFGTTLRGIEALVRRTGPPNLERVRIRSAPAALNGTEFRPPHTSPNSVISGTRGNPSGLSLNGSDFHSKH